MAKKDVVVILGDWADDGPIDVQLVAKGVAGRKAALKKIIQTLTDEGKVQQAEDNPHERPWMHAEDGRLYIDATVGGVTIHVALELDDNGRVEVYDAREDEVAK